MEDDWLAQFWVLARKADPAADIIAYRDLLLSEFNPDEHVPGCVTMDGEWICSPFCPVNPKIKPPE